MLVALEYVSMGHGLKYVELVTQYGIMSLLVLSALLDSHLMVMCLSMSSLSTPKSEGFLLIIISASTSSINFVAYVFSV